MQKISFQIRQQNEVSLKKTRNRSRMRQKKNNNTQQKLINHQNISIIRETEEINIHRCKHL